MLLTQHKNDNYYQSNKTKSNDIQLCLKVVGLSVSLFGVMWIYCKLLKLQNQYSENNIFHATLPEAELLHAAKSDVS